MPNLWTTPSQPRPLPTEMISICSPSGKTICITDLDLLLEQALREVDLLADVAAVDLDLDDLGLPSAEHDGLRLRVRDHPDNARLGLDLSDPLLGLALALLGGRERLLHLRLVPVLVVAPLDLLTDEASPRGRDRLQALWGLLVADDANGDHGRGLDDGDWLDGLLLVQAGVRTDDLTNNVGHAGLEADESAEMRLLGLVILRPRPDAAPNVAGAAAREETEGSTAWCVELAVAHSSKRPVEPRVVNICVGVFGLCLWRYMVAVK